MFSFLIRYNAPASSIATHPYENMRTYIITIFQENNNNHIEEITDDEGRVSTLKETVYKFPIYRNFALDGTIGFSVYTTESVFERMSAMDEAQKKTGAFVRSSFNVKHGNNLQLCRMVCENIANKWLFMTPSSENVDMIFWADDTLESTK